MMSGQMREGQKIRNWMRSCALGMTALLCLSGPIAASPFEALKGSWSGKGAIKLENGKSENIACRAYYTTKDAGSRLGLSIRCASPSNNINLRAKLNKASAGGISGTWEERTFNANGTVSGQSSASSMRLNISGTLTGSVSIIINGRSQQVSIFSSNAGMNGVTIRMRKTS